MCGLVGSASRTRQVSKLTDGLALLNHRGPDDSGQWFSLDGRVALGHVRLAIQDLSPVGRQPMCSACGRYVIVFNGEIYNFMVLREQLLRLGYSFRSNIDTEVVLAAYQEWGSESVKFFNGMFGLAIH